MKRLITNLLFVAFFSLSAAQIFGQSKPVFFGSGVLANPNQIRYIQADKSVLNMYKR